MSFTSLLLLLLLLNLSHSTTINNFYDILSISSTATKKDIKKAYRSQARLIHPDKHPASQKEKYEALFVKLAEAYSVLSDDSKRQAYDNGNYNDNFNSNFDEAFKHYGYDGVQDTPANWLALILVSSMLILPIVFVGIKHLRGKSIQDNVTRLELLKKTGITPKTKQEIEKEKQRKQTFDKQQKERAIQKEIQRSKQQEQRQKAAAKEASVVISNIQAHVPIHKVISNRSNTLEDVQVEINHYSVPWNELEKKRFGMASKKYGMGTPNRWERIAKYMGTRDKKGVTNYVKMLKNGENLRLKKLKLAKKDVVREVVEVEVEVEKWTAEAQLKFEEALRGVPRTLSKQERWNEIALRVGKSRSECVKRFKELREKLSTK